MFVKPDTEGWPQTLADEVLEQAPEWFPFAPRGSRVDPNAPKIKFTINRKVDVWAENLEELYEKAKREQWNASLDVPWNSMARLPEDVERAISQVMTFLAENEYIALYLPAKFLPQINPYYSEVVKFLSTQLVDEARHVEVFVKRAILGAGLQNVSAATQHALKSLMDVDDYVKAKFLLNILGEGTFDDLFTLLIKITPDPVCRRLFELAKRDEARHVAYGIRRTQYQLRKVPSLGKRLLEAIEERANYLFAVAGADPFVTEALAILAGGGSDPRQLEAGMKVLAQHHQYMHEMRVERLRLCGFDRETAEKISALHSSAVKSFM
jgi:hypothetical protein